MADAAAWRPLRYRLRSVGGMQVLAHDPAGPGRIVEVFGELAAAHVAVVVPGNAQSLADYRIATGGAALRRACLALYATLHTLAPQDPAAVVAWLGYRCPVGLRAAATPAAARAGAADLRALTRWLPAATHLSLIGHSYGSLVCALAAAQGGRVDDLVALASPGLGVRHAAQLATTARIWAVRGADDWVRLVPQVRIGRYGHGRQPTHPRFGANVLDCPDTRGHSGYYTPGTRTLQTIATIVLGTTGQAAAPAAHRRPSTAALAAG